MNGFRYIPRDGLRWTTPAHDATGLPLSELHARDEPEPRRRPPRGVRHLAGRPIDWRAAKRLTRVAAQAGKDGLARNVKIKIKGGVQDGRAVRKS